MNRKEFEIFTKYRNRKLVKDLEACQDKYLYKFTSHGREEERLRNDYNDEISMEKEKMLSFEKERKELRLQRIILNTSNVLLAISALGSFLGTVWFSSVTLKHSRENLELNYLPSVDVQSNLKAEVIVYNRGRSNLYLWGTSFNDAPLIPDDHGRLVVPNGLEYRLYSESLFEILVKLLGNKESIHVPLELFFKDERGEKYVSTHYFYVFREDNKVSVRLQTVAIKKKSW